MVPYFFYRPIWLAVLCFVFTATGAYASQLITVNRLSSPPVLDGSSDDWSEKTLIKIPLTNNKKDGKSDVRSVFLMAGTHADNFYMYVQWFDSTENKIHKPFVWNSSEERYVRGPQREDRFSIQFEMEGDYTTRWFSGNEFKADMWHWKSSRTNPANLAHDKMTIISSTPLKKSYKTTAENGKTIYLFRPSDTGEPIYFSKRYSMKEKELMPKYIIATDPKGSITDVKVKGFWRDGKWMLELKRKLNTGHPDDVIFRINTSIKAGIGIFNSSESNDHNISETLIFQF